MSDEFAYSKDEENYHGTFDTRDQAIAAARGDYGDAETIFTGRMVHPSAEEFMPDADHIVEYMVERACDISAEITETYLDDWHPTNRKEKGAAITADLYAAIGSIFEKHGFSLQPHFFTVDQVEEHKP